MAYNCAHAITLFYQVITLNVAVNSYSNALLTLLMSNQFVEIKGSVFKRFEKENIFQLTCADVVERFQLWIVLLIIGMRNVVEVGGLSVPGAGVELGDDATAAPGPLHNPSVLPMSFTILPSWFWSGEVLSPFLIVIGSEMLVDWVKHAYINKFNTIKPNFYGRVLDILCKDYYTNVSLTTTDLCGNDPNTLYRLLSPLRLRADWAFPCFPSPRYLYVPRFRPTTCFLPRTCRLPSLAPLKRRYRLNLLRQHRLPSQPLLTGLIMSSATLWAARSTGSRTKLSSTPRPLGRGVSHGSPGTLTTPSPW